MNKTKNNYGGALISKPDERDYPAGSYLPTGGYEKLDYFFADSIPEIIYNQGVTAKCVAYSLKEIIEHFNKKEYDQHIPMSVDFIFSNRESGQDSCRLLPFEGAYPKDLIHNMYKFGACEDNLSPTQQPDYFDDFIIHISDEMYKNAIKYVLRMYLKITTNDEIKSALYNGCGVTASIPITSKFKGGYNTLITQSYADKYRKTNHMIVIWGWKKYNGINYWICKNSSGSEWGDKGWFYLPFGYPTNEIWALTDKVFPHWSDKYYQYLKDNNNIIFDERGYDLKATRGYCFKYMAKALGYTGDDSYIGYWNYLNTKTVVYEQRFDSLITRAEVFALLSRLKSYKEPTPNIPPHWGQKYWDYLNNECGIKIYETRFNDNITRAETITLLARLLNFPE